MELTDQANVNVTLCKHSDVSGDPKAPLTGSIQFYQQRAYNQHAEQPIEDLNSGQLTSDDSEECTRCLQQILFEMDLQDERDKPWAGARSERIADYFNYDLNERSFREFIRNQIRVRFEKRSRTALGGGHARGHGGLPGRGTGYLGSGGHASGQKNFPGYGQRNFREEQKSSPHQGPGDWYAKGGTESDTIYAIGFPKAWSKEEMQGYFAQFGIVMNCHLMPGNGAQRAAGIVNYMTTAMAREAISGANGAVVEGSDGAMEVRYKFKGKKGTGKKRDFDAPY